MSFGDTIFNGVESPWAAAKKTSLDRAQSSAEDACVLTG